MVIFGYASVNAIDVITRAVRFFIPKVKTFMMFLMLLNFPLSIGFFIAMHVVRFRGSGKDCALSLLYYRGHLILYYVIAVWSFIGLTTIAVIIQVFVKRRK